ncbi:MAG: lysophospholipase [Bacteroidia bacterium]|nr:lysophospholipase [Bacteroidia bacterium]
MDFNIKLSNGQILRGFIKSPGENLRAVVIFVHGRGEHIQRYSNWAGLFNEVMIGFAGVDLPGHGRSDGKSGHIKNYALTDEMIDILLDECRKTFPGVPLFLYGHSLGGGIVLDYLVRKDPKVKGAIVTSPWLKLSFKPKESMVRLANMLRIIFPSLILPAGLVVEHLSHDQKVVDAFKNDPLNHNKISLSLFHAAKSAASNALNNAASLNKPLLLMHGTDDHICSPEGSREFASKTTMAELKLWDGGYHELHNDLYRYEVFNYIIAWLNSRLA